MNTSRRSVLAALGFTGAAIAAPALAAEEATLVKSRNAYAALKSYSDTGVIESEYREGNGAGIRERHRFTTRFRQPRHFYFEFDEDAGAGGEKLVVWSDDSFFYGWWSTTQVESQYPKGQGATAFVSSSHQTRGSILSIAPWLFPQAGLQGALTAFTDATPDGEEMIAGRKCYRLKGIQRTFYATGRALPTRRTTIWIDAETLLVRRIFEDTPSGRPASHVSRTTTTFDPKPNPSLTDAQFKFAPPVAE